DRPRPAGTAFRRPEPGGDPDSARRPPGRGRRGGTRPAEQGDRRRLPRARGRGRRRVQLAAPRGGHLSPSTRWYTSARFSSARERPPAAARPSRLRPPLVRPPLVRPPPSVRPRGRRTHLSFRDHDLGVGLATPIP